MQRPVKTDAWGPAFPTASVPFVGRMAKETHRLRGPQPKAGGKESRASAEAGQRLAGGGGGWEEQGKEQDNERKKEKEEERRKKSKGFTSLMGEEWLTR